MQLQDTCDMYTCVRISSTCLLRSQSRYFEINSVSNQRRILLFILLYCSYLLNPHCYQVPSTSSAPSIKVGLLCNVFPQLQLAKTACRRRIFLREKWR